MAKKKAKREQKKAEMGAKKEEKKRLKKVIKMEKAFEKEERKLEKVLRKKLEALEEAKDVTGSKKRKAGDTRVLTLQSPKQKKKKLEEPEFSPFDSSSVSLTRARWVRYIYPFPYVRTFLSSHVRTHLSVQPWI